MTFHRPSTLPDYIFSDRFLTNLSPLSSQPQRKCNPSNSNRRDVPRGTVALRISHLQSLANPSLTNIDVQPSSKRHRDVSRTGFGRRLNSRFAEPASRNTRVAEDSQIDCAHTFLGLASSRKNHEEAHAMAEHRVTFERSPGIHGQMKPQGFVQMVQYDAASPWAAMSKMTNPSRCSRQARSDQDAGLLTERSPSVQGRPARDSPNCPCPSVEESFNTYRQETGLRRDENFGSESSIVTTSDVRRQSVRDLYHDHGVVRPERLLSSRESSPDVDNTPRPVRTHRYCHMCTSVNNTFSGQCWRCGHRLCIVCNNLSPHPPNRAQPIIPTNTQMEADRGCDNAVKPLSPPQLKQNKSLSVVVPKRPGPQVIQPSKTAYRAAPRKKSSPTIQFPTFDTKNPIGGTEFSKSSATHSVPNPPLVPRGLPQSKAHMRMSVKHSPFIMADFQARASGSPSASRAADKLSSRPTVDEKPYSKREVDNKCESIDQPTATTDDGSCQSPSCNAAYKGFRPKRHTLRCSQSRHEKTDQGYVADISHMDDHHETTSPPPAQKQHGELEKHSNATYEQVALASNSSFQFPNRGQAHSNDELSQTAIASVLYSPTCPQSPKQARGSDNAPALASENTKSLPTKKRTTFINEASKPPTPRPWRSFPRDVNKTAPSVSVDEHVKRALKKEANTDSSADTGPEMMKHASFSTYDASANHTNITTPDRASVSKPTGNTLGLPANMPKAYTEYQTKGEGSPLLKEGNFRALAKSPASSIKTFSMKSPCLVDSKARPAVPELTRKLQVHQEELRRLEKELSKIRSKNKRCQSSPNSKSIQDHMPSDFNEVSLSWLYQDESPPQNAQSVNTSTPQNSQANQPLHAEQTQILQKPALEQVCSNAETNEIDINKKKLKLKLTPRRELNKSFERNFFAELASDGYPCTPSPARQSDMHECIWRRLFLDEQRVRDGEMDLADGVVRGGPGGGAGAKSLSSSGVGGIMSLDSENKAGVKKGEMGLGLRGLTLVAHWSG